jgi:hypothetical protein
MNMWITWMNEADDYLLHVHYMNEDDDEFMILKINMYTIWTRWWNYVENIYVLCASHKVLSHGTIVLWSGSYDNDDG